MRTYHAELVFIADDDGGFLTRELVSTRAETEENACEYFDGLCEEKEASYWDFL